MNGTEKSYITLFKGEYLAVKFAVAEANDRAGAHAIDQLAERAGNDTHVSAMSWPTTFAGRLTPQQIKKLFDDVEQTTPEQYARSKQLEKNLYQEYGAELRHLRWALSAPEYRANVKSRLRLAAKTDVNDARRALRKDLRDSGTSTL